jgi:DNA (cytosine-5)-methyltransferase 1
MVAFYNECDPTAAQWLRNLINVGHIAPGIVDERPIQEIEAFELSRFTQCHFFAGIGVWSYALRRAGWSDDRPVWTGSCPCQPFSNSGLQKGISDERHLWPYWEKLIADGKPSAVIGEQVASKGGLEWLDIVSADLEKSGYAFGAADLCAAGFSGAHIRQRLYFVGLADAESIGSGSGLRNSGSTGEGLGRPLDSDSGTIRRLADTDNAGLERRLGMSECANQCVVGSHGMVSGLADEPRNGRREERSDLEGSIIGNQKERIAAGLGGGGGDSGTNAPMLGRTPVDWLFCRDGKWRPVEPGTFPLAHAAPARVGRLRAYGNALDAETATQFCTVVKEICDGV